MKRQLDKYPAGKPVRVWYDPKNPAQAVLEKEWVGLVGGLLPVAIFAGLAWLFAHHGGSYGALTPRRRALMARSRPVGGR